MLFNTETFTCEWNYAVICPGGKVQSVCYLYVYKYEKFNLCMSVRVFLGHFETDWDSLWHKVDLYPWEGSKAVIFQKSFFLHS